MHGVVNGKLWTDGFLCGGKIMRRPKTIKLEGIRTSPTTLHRFSFSAVRTTDDSSFMSNPNSPEVGEIKVVIQILRVLDNLRATYPTTPTETIFHETTKKCIGHQTSLRPTTTAEAKVARVEEYGDP
ncbi:hypothetical protein L218DRAFT_625980 [Marasmius fiardii PR-910]|nr:hypothetical protein L218DRAFT_625980 [Marasmius fiardii PR-910]